MRSRNSTSPNSSISKFSFLYGILVLSIVCLPSLAKKSDPENKPSWAKKDIRDYNDADLERLLDQWEVG